MLIIGQLALAILLSAVIGFFLYWRFREQVQGMLKKQREKYLHTEKTYVQRQEELELDLFKSSRVPGWNLSRKLEEHFPLSYQVNVYNRMIKETKFTERKIMELIFEMKRFLILASVLKSVPMYSKDVDEVWHQMLMFTREYKALAEGFAGQFIHHAPNVNGVDEKDSKFIFDMMYLELFSAKPFSAEHWGSKFFSEKPSDELIRSIQTETHFRLVERYFFNTPHAQNAGSEIVARIQKSMLEAKNSERQRGFESSRRKTMDEARNPSKKSDSFDTPYALPYVFWASEDDKVPFSDSLGHTSTTASTDSGSTGGGGSSSFFGGGSNNCSSGSGSGSSCGSSCGGGGCGSS